MFPVVPLEVIPSGEQIIIVAEFPRANDPAPEIVCVPPQSRVPLTDISVPVPSEITRSASRISVAPASTVSFPIVVDVLFVTILGD